MVLPLYSHISSATHGTTTLGIAANGGTGGESLFHFHGDDFYEWYFVGHRLLFGVSVHGYCLVASPPIGVVTESQLAILMPFNKMASPVGPAGTVRLMV